MPDESRALINPHNPHELLATMSILRSVSRAAGLYFVDGEERHRSGYLMRAHTTGHATDGYAWLTNVELNGTDAFPPPSNLTAVPINGKLELASGGTDASGVIGVGLGWDLPVRTPGTVQNHAVRYLINRTETSTGQIHPRDIFAGYSEENGELITPNYQLIDLGEDGNVGLNGAYTYEVRGVDLFGRITPPVTTNPIAVRSFTIPPSPVDLHAQMSDPGLDVTFSWTAGEHAKDPGVRKFEMYLDNRQITPVIGKITSSSNTASHTVVQIQPDNAEWDTGEGLVGGAVQIFGVPYEVYNEINRAPLQLQVARIPDIVTSGTRCILTSNWRAAGNWSNNPFSLEFSPAPSNAEITDVLPIDGFPGERMVFLDAQPFATQTNVTVATILQGNVEFAARTVPGQPMRFSVELFRTEDGAEFSPMVGPVQLYPRITISIPEFVIGDIVPGDELRKSFSVGVTAVDDPSDGTNEGPVSPRAIVHWVSTGTSAGPIFNAPSDLTSVAADRASSDRMSRYTLKWDPVDTASRYHVFRAAEEVVVVIDQDRTGRAPNDYENMTLFQLWELANDSENSRAFDRLTSDPIEPIIDGDGRVSYFDQTLPGHSTSRFFYRVRPVGETGLVGGYSDVFQPVHCPRARPSEQLSIHRRRVDGADVYLYWQHIPDSALDYYIVYRTTDRSIAESKHYKKFEHATKVLSSENARPLFCRVWHC